MGFVKNRQKGCRPYASKDLDERRLVLLRSMVIGIRPQDVTPDLPASVSQLKLKPEELPAALLSSDVNVCDLAAVITKDAMKKLKLGIRKRVDMDTWRCACCNIDLGLEKSVECSGCLQWYHYRCAGYKRKCKSNWFCSVCVQCQM